MNKNILGIDLGTSSVKLLLRYKDGKTEKSHAKYKNNTPEAFPEAVKEASQKLDMTLVEAIGLSSQVGTYIINENHMISWNEPYGKEELEFIKSKYAKEIFIKEISMPHPDIISYPIPRLMYIKKHFSDIKNICQPKDYLIKALTGNFVTDKYSLRGLVNTKTGKYSDFFLNELEIDINLLPPVVNPYDLAGTTTKECEESLGIPQGIPVYAGLNDFFASLLGMGIKESGDMFDITGTSEHIGIITDKLNADTKMVSGVYEKDYINYGVTASSGASMDFAIKEFGLSGIDIENCLKNNAPIFTPYVNGERAPIFDTNARGVFFGISSKTTKAELAYSVLEGVAFSIYHIYENLNLPIAEKMVVSGGASKDRLLNQIKAELFGIEILTLSENDTSALGGVISAAKGLNIDTTDFNSVQEYIKPTGKYKDILIKRYNIYKNLYSSLKDEFKHFTKLERI